MCARACLRAGAGVNDSGSDGGTGERAVRPASRMPRTRPCWRTISKHCFPVTRVFPLQHVVWREKEREGGEIGREKKEREGREKERERERASERGRDGGRRSQEEGGRGRQGGSGWGGVGVERSVFQSARVCYA